MISPSEERWYSRAILPFVRAWEEGVEAIKAGTTKATEILRNFLKVEYELA